MNEHRPGEGGPANTPPFPPIEHGSPVGEPLAPHAALPPTPRLQDDTPLDFVLSGDVEEHDEEIHDDFDDEDDDVYDDDLDWRASADDYAPPAADPDESDDPADGPEPDAVETGFAARARDRVKRRAAESAHRGFEQFADRLDDVAERIDRLASDRLGGSGTRERAADAAHSTAGWIAGVSDYLREADLDELRSELEDQVRRNPLRSVLIAVGAGWLLGRIIR
jgi:ElaB/YqjD/DUF883 family membrane-anchored ribosome-binding protein